MGVDNKGRNTPELSNKMKGSIDKWDPRISKVSQLSILMKEFVDQHSNITEKYNAGVCGSEQLHRNTDIIIVSVDQYCITAEKYKRVYRSVQYPS